MMDQADVREILQSATIVGNFTQALSDTAPYFDADNRVPESLWFLRAQVAERGRDYEKTLFSLRRAITCDDPAPGHLFHVAQFLVNTGQPWAACEIIERLKRTHGDQRELIALDVEASLDAGYYRRGCKAAEKLKGNPASNEDLLRMAINKAMAEDYKGLFKLIGKNGAIYANLVEQLLAIEGFEAAYQISKKATEIWPQENGAWNARGVSAAELDDINEAVACYERAVGLAPDDLDALRNLASVFANLGRNEEASHHFDEVLTRSPKDVGALRNYVEIIKFSDNHPLIATLEEMAVDPGLSDNERAAAHYNLGKAYDDAGRHIDAMQCFLAGGQVKAQSRQLSWEDEIALLNRVKSLFQKLDIGGAESNESSARPVFIVGLPRSGTTLLEQILSAHPKVHAAGELPSLRDAVLRHADQRLGRRTLPAWEFVGAMPELNAAQTKEIARDYLNAIWRIDSNAARVIDKQPMNDRYLGFAALAFPNARFIHCVRDIRDTCVSCLSKNFEAEIAFTDSIESVSAYAKAQRKLMAFWQERFSTQITTVSYEQLVQDTEAVVRALLNRLDLDWSDACLDHANTNRAVRTASAQQVREGINTNAVERWRRYMPEIEPLVKMLEGH